MDERIAAHSRCRRCLPGVSARAAAEQMAEYVESLPDTVRVTDAEYAERLALCGACAWQRDGTCALCGCFVQARAAKWRLACPDPAQPKWGQGCPRV